MKKHLNEFLREKNQTYVNELPDYLGQAIVNGVDELEVSPGQLFCLYSFFHMPADWDFKIWGIKIIIK
jgi:hypothetical protein